MQAQASVPSYIYVQGAAQQAAELRQAVQQLQHQLQNSAAAAKHAEQQFREKVQQLQCSNVEKQNSVLQLEQMCQATQMQLQVPSAPRLHKLITMQVVMLVDLRVLPVSTKLCCSMQSIQYILNESHQAHTAASVLLVLGGSVCS